MAAEFTCSNCKWWWQPKNVISYGGDYGQCRRMPPVVHGAVGLLSSGYPKAHFGFPTTTHHLFCGEHSHWSMD